MDNAEVAGTSFRRRVRGGRQAASSRKRREGSESSEEEPEEGTSVVKDGIRRRKRHNPLIQSTNKKKAMANSKKGSSSSSEDAGEGDSASTEIIGAFKSSGTAERLGPSDMGATAVSEIDTDVREDAQAQFERVQKTLKEGFDEKIYMGAAMYGAKEKRDTALGNASSGLNRVGPIRAPNFIRQSVRWDFAPDICKDYKETGFCTFGDSCKFLHDRTDYKHGWEIERDYAAGRMKEDDEDKYLIHSSDEEDDQLPFKCFICRESFKNPVVTRCKHYFCEKCALDNFRKTPKCFVCDEHTKGVFNVAKDLIAKLKEKEDEEKATKRKESDSSGDEGEIEDTKMEKLDDDDDDDGDGDGDGDADGSLSSPEKEET